MLWTVSIFCPGELIHVVAYQRSMVYF
jgi:hypothetical protein